MVQIRVCRWMGPLDVNMMLNLSIMSDKPFIDQACVVNEICLGTG